MKKITILLAAIILFFFGCGKTSTEKLDTQTKTDTHEEHQHDTETESIELNNGEKWKVNDEMLPPIKNMEKDINDYSIAEQKDYKALAEKLQLNIDLLISSCTMKGKAHNELHKWLLPYIDLVEELSKAKDETEAAIKIENIKNSFTTFNKYFQ